MVRILWAVREAVQDESIQLQDLFDLDPSNPANWQD